MYTSLVGPLLLALIVGCVALESVPRYEVYEITLNGESKGNPYHEIVDVTFTLQSKGQGVVSRYPSATIPCFYTGNNVWRARFSPDVEGTWTWVSSSKEASLHGHQGSVLAVENLNANTSHGAILVDPDHKHHFKYEDGSRYLMVGYEADWLWALGLPGVNTGGITLDGFVKMTTSYGFNHYLVNVYANYSSWGEKVKAPPRVAPTHLTPWGFNGDLNYGAMDETYFAQLDKTVEALRDNGAICHLMITVWNKAVNWPPHESKDDDLFWRYVAGRYQAYSNIIFDISKEANRESDSYWATRQPLLASLNAHHRLMTSHTHCPDYKYCDFVSAQVHKNYYDNIITTRKQHDIPIANVEFEYEEGPINTYGPHSSAIDMLPVMWSLYMAGGYGAWYYADTAWDVITADQTPGYHYCKYLSEFFNGVKYWEMNPDNTVVAASGTYYGLVNPGKEYVVFVDDKESFSVTLSGVTGGLKAAWFDPQTGQSTPESTTYSSGNFKFNPPSSIKKQAVLHLY